MTRTQAQIDQRKRIDEQIAADIAAENRMYDEMEGKDLE